MAVKVTKVLWLMTQHFQSITVRGSINVGYIAFVQCSLSVSLSGVHCVSVNGIDKVTFAPTCTEEGPHQGKQNEEWPTSVRRGRRGGRRKVSASDKGLNAAH